MPYFSKILMLVIQKKVYDRYLLLACLGIWTLLFVLSVFIRGTGKAWNNWWCGRWVRSLLMPKVHVTVPLQSLCSKISFLHLLLSRGKFATLSHLDGWCIFDAANAIPRKQSGCGADSVRICWSTRGRCHTFINVFIWLPWMLVIMCTVLTVCTISCIWMGKWWLFSVAKEFFVPNIVEFPCYVKQTLNFFLGVDANEVLVRALPNNFTGFWEHNWDA